MMNTSKEKLLETEAEIDAAASGNAVSVDNRLDQISAKWKQHTGTAKILWGKLTDDELLKTEGQLQRLSGLVQERYALTKDVAEKQVQDFFSTLNK
jgi:uncharacterized protein YjbJ (UPF0337 family)